MNHISFFKGSFRCAHTDQYIFDYVNKCIKDIGHENVVQIVTDSASNNMVAANLLALEWSNIFWTSCATHTINLMLEGISKAPFSSRKFLILPKIQNMKIFNVF